MSIFHFEESGIKKEISSIVYSFNLKINNEYVLEEGEKKVFSIQIENNYNECHKKCIKHFLEKIKNKYTTENELVPVNTLEILNEINSTENGTDDE